MASRVFQSLKGDHDQAVENCLGVGTAETTGIEMAGYELQNPKVGTDETESSLLIFHEQSLVRGCKILLNIEGIKVPTFLISGYIMKGFEITITGAWD